MAEKQNGGGVWGWQGAVQAGLTSVNSQMCSCCGCSGHWQLSAPRFQAYGVQGLGCVRPTVRERHLVLPEGLP